eukprot:3114616-Pleurochrysis_carterae.AAC.1
MFTVAQEVHEEPEQKAPNNASCVAGHPAVHQLFGGPDLVKVISLRACERERKSATLRASTPTTLHGCAMSITPLYWCNARYAE